MTGERLPSALDRIAEILSILGDRPAIFLDYDGTLTPIVPDPADARIGDDQRAVLSALARRVPVAIISGRNLDELRGLVGVEGLVYAGNHGWEIEGPGIDSFMHPQMDGVPRQLDAAQELLAKGTADLEGVVLERKRFALAVHTRRVESDAVRRAAIDLASDTVAQLDGLRLTLGKEIAELRPAVDWDKGNAVGLVLDSLDPLHTPLFVGDDRTDEDGFGEAARHRGAGVVVGQPEQTAARFRLSDPSEVMVFLNQLAERIAKTNLVS